LVIATLSGGFVAGWFILDKKGWLLALSCVNVQLLKSILVNLSDVHWCVCVFVLMFASTMK